MSQPAKGENTRRRRIRWGQLGVIFAVWTLIALLGSSQSYLGSLNTDEPESFHETFLAVIHVVYPWVLLTPLIFWLGRTFPIERRNWLRGGLIHVVLGSLVSLVFAVYLAAMFSMVPMEGHTYEMTFQALLVRLLGSNFLLQFLVYWGVLGVGLAVNYYTLFREREVHASQLKTQLAQAQLRALRMQIQPHFLFNTLHTISALMDEDKPGARRMIARLSELLRLTLETGDRHEVTLREEMELIDHYLRIEEVRFQDRLTVERDVEPGVLGARVPSLVLQPLVENAIRHGLGSRSDDGRLAIVARQEGGELRLEVRDNGRGLAGEPGVPPDEGIGLSNTRKRLQQIYGDAGRLELENIEGGGLRAIVRMPLRTGDTDADADAGELSAAMDAIRILIVDDERLARRRIRKLLNGRRDVEIVGESANGREAVAAIREERPDVIFLDVQMPVLDGFGALAELGDGEMPVVVFTTAYDQYALQAFEVHALDYLLKPFDDERFEQALERARAQVQRSKADDLGTRLQELLADHKAKAGGTGEAGDPERLVVKSGGRITFLDLDEIDWIEAEGSYVNLHAGKRSHLLRETMNSLEARLPTDRFLRVHRSTIVNLARVRELQERHGDHRVVLEGGEKLAVSQRYREKLHKALGL